MSAPAALLALCIVGLLLYAAAWVITLVWCAWPRPARPSAAGPRPGVTFLKPLCGPDEELEANLASFFALDHAPLQLVFGAAAADDPALAVARRLAAAHPRHDVTIVVGSDAAAGNPKVAVMEHLLPHARHDLIVISDSNVRVRPDEVGRVLPGFADPRVGMVYQPVVGIGERSLPAALENLHYAEYCGLLSVFATVVTGQHAVNGKGQWLRRAALDAIGGLAGVRDQFADDLILSRLVAGAGWRLRLAPPPARIVHRDWSWRSFFSRHLRHASLRCRVAPHAYPLELLLNPVPWTLLLAATSWAWAVVPLVVLKAALELSATRVLRGVPTPWRYAAAVPLKDLLFLAIWFVALTRRTVRWRGRTYRIGPDATLVPLAPAPGAPAAGAVAP